MPPSLKPRPTFPCRGGGGATAQAAPGVAYSGCPAATGGGSCAGAASCGTGGPYGGTSLTSSAYRVIRDPEDRTTGTRGPGSTSGASRSPCRATRSSTAAGVSATGSTSTASTSSQVSGAETVGVGRARSEYPATVV